VHDIRGFSSTVRIRPEPYLPLTNDAQAMALVKEIRVNVRALKNGSWLVGKPPRYDFKEVMDADLNRAIVYCVAAMQAARSSDGR